jgi:hypothetical protein
MKYQIHIPVILIAAALTIGGHGCTFFSNKKTQSNKPVADDFISNTCWVYHEYVFKVEFVADTTFLPPLFFVRNEDGTFSPSKADSAGNHVTGNGFIIDSSGACMITDYLNEPWLLTEEERIPLIRLIKEWLSLQPGRENIAFDITGQTIALFVLLRKPQQYIEYTVSASSLPMNGGKLIYPVQRVLLKGMTSQFKFQPATVRNLDKKNYSILKAIFNEQVPESPEVIITQDSITATVNADGYLENIQTLKGDGLFAEGSALFDTDGNWAGILTYIHQKWRLLPALPSPGTSHDYDDVKIYQEWKFDGHNKTWQRLAGTSIITEN